MLRSFVEPWKLNTQYLFFDAATISFRFQMGIRTIEKQNRVSKTENDGSSEIDPPPTPRQRSTFIHSIDCSHAVGKQPWLIW